MKKIVLVGLTFALLSCFAPPLPAADDSGPAKDLKELVGKVQEKLKAGKRTEADLADDLKAFDELLAKYKDQKTDDVAQILQMKAMLYLSVLEQPDKAKGLIEQLKKDFPDTKQGKGADRMLENIEKQGAARKIQAELVPGKAFPDFDEKDLEGQPLSVARFKGKVVLVDFWATWCGPCVGELPNVQKAYEAFHSKGFEILGISLDNSEEKLKTFLKGKNMTWPQYFDGKGWQTKLAGKYGVNSIPATYLLDGEGKIIAKNLRGEALYEAVEKALAKK